MSKLAFSFGAKKPHPPSKPAPGKRKPTTFGGDDDDDSAPKGATVAAAKVEQISTLDFDDLPSATLQSPNRDTHRDGKGKSKSKPLPAPPPHPPGGKKTEAVLGDLSSALESKKYAAQAESEDPSIYDYDSVYDSFKLPTRKAAEKEEVEKKPKYFSALQKAAEIRERDRQIAEEKRLKREREVEGDEFADKEKFVTEAYKKQQEENRRLEEEEKRREEEEQKKNKSQGGGMTSFYKDMLKKEEEEHAAKMKAAEERLKHKAETGGGAGEEEQEEEEEKSAAERAREINAKGGNVIINDEGEVVDKRQLLTGGLNVKKKTVEAKEKAKQQQQRDGGNTGSVGDKSKGVYAAGGKQAMRQRQTRMLEAQLEETLKRAREEEEEERKKVELVAKSRKTEADISSAKERYLARKRAQEEAKKNGTAEVP
ncbi:nuclear speckle splicing regulatory protein 1 [Diplogelasinospora grovesii]|uniref:Nuclear speckle splicing regulatory protein 1 n=1 Tax=Diplogelasinospora grovesii TaxID=303347 RepID=A0AAN6NF84_9PEZI|nr:nuclear speckle splicing regulatory protein 1 [Diplogelasinospora grovesii]